MTPSFCFNPALNNAAPTRSSGGDALARTQEFGHNSDSSLSTHHLDTIWTPTWLTTVHDEWYDQAGNYLALSHIWGYSSAGRALAWHARGQRFDPAYLHQQQNRSQVLLVVEVVQMLFGSSAVPIV